MGQIIFYPVHARRRGVIAQELLFYTRSLRYRIQRVQVCVLTLWPDAISSRNNGRTDRKNFDEKVGHFIRYSEKNVRMCF